MKRRTFLIAASAMAQGPPPPPTFDPGSTEDILRPVGQQGLSPMNAGNRAQLFVSNMLVRSMQGVWAVPHQAEKLPQPVMKADRPWEGWRLCLFGNVIFDREAKLYKMWYLGESGEKARVAYFPQTEYNQTMYATSHDGIN